MVYCERKHHWGMDYIGATRIHNRDASGILVGLVDGGMDVTHRIFEGNLWTRNCHQHSPRQGGSSRLEEVNAGRVIDFTQFSPDCSNQVSGSLAMNHGTQVASIVGGRPVEGIFQGGVAHSLKILPLKVQPISPEHAVDAICMAIQYAIEQEVNILNCSFIIYGKNDRLKSIFEKAIQSGMLIVAAAGNEDENLEEYPGYPASLTSNSLITVGAIQSGFPDHLSACSNEGALVDIAAPGDGELYLSAHKRVEHPPGKTSYAAAYVTGVAALVWARLVDRSLTRREQTQKVKEVILCHARKVIPRLKTGNPNPRIKTWGDGNPILNTRFLGSGKDF